MEIKESPETNESNEPKNDQNVLVVSKDLENNLTSIRKWVTFFSVLGIISAAFMAIFAIAFVFISPIKSAASVAFVTYLLIATLYFIPSLWGIQFNNLIKLSLINKDQNSLELGFQKEKLRYKFYGILTIVVISIYLLIFLFVGSSFLNMYNLF